MDRIRHNSPCRGLTSYLASFTNSCNIDCNTNRAVHVGTRPARIRRHNLISFEDHLRSEYGHLSKGQQQIADHLLAQVDDIMFASSRQLAERCAVSESAIVRFAQRLGYGGFPEMRRAIREEFREIAGHQVMMTSGMRRLPNDGSLISDIVNLDSELITRTAQLLDAATLEDSARRMSDAKNVLVVGHRTSHGLAEYFASALRQGVGKGAPLEFGIGMAYDIIASLDSDTVILAITLSPHARETLAMLEAARLQGVHCIAITDQPRGAAAELATAALIIDTDLQVFTSSYIGVMTTLHVLLALIGRYSDQTAHQFLAKVEAQRQHIGRR